MDYNKRIDDNFLKADYVDGEVLQHTDMNELESVVKLGVNANYEDIQKIQDGTISVENSNKLSGATLSKVSSETLQNSDVKVPTSAQVKQYIDSAISSIDLTGYASEVFVENEIADTVEIYDSNGNGIVDNAEKVNNHTVLKDVPSDAKFTDTIYDDTEVRGLISDLDDDKVDKVTGKGLSTNDFTNTYKTKLDGIASGAQVNVIEKVKVNGTQQSVSSKAVDISVPTQLSQLSDDSTHRLVTDTEKTTWNNKADLEDIPSLVEYVKFYNYPLNGNSGVVRVDTDRGISVSNVGDLRAETKTYSQYTSANNNMFISKGTLENVITGKNLETADNKVTEITESSTDTEYPSAKAVYDFASGGAEEEEIEALREEDGYLNSVIDQLPRDEATGTSATLQPTIQARMKMSLAPSEMTQHSYSGKNLLPNELPSQEINGLTIGVDSDGVVSISGTANAQTILSLYLNAQSTITVPSGTCYLSTNLGGTVTGGSNPAWFKIIGTNNVQESMDITDADGMSFSVASDWNLAIGQIICQESQTFTNVKIYPMVSTSSDTTYEPYVGGTATPSPLYPEEIHTISGDNSVVVEGKNYIDLTKHTNTLASNTTVSSNSITCQSTGAWQGKVVSPIELEPNTDYKISCNANSNATYSILDYIKGTKNGVSTNIVNSQYFNYFKNGYSFNSGDYDSWEISFYTVGNSTSYSGQTLVLDELMIEKGTTKTSFIPYQEPQTAPINLGNIEYCKIGDYSDEFIYNTTDTNLELNKWYLKKNIGKVVLDGTEAGWQCNNISALRYPFGIQMENKQYFTSTKDGLLCDTFMVDTSSEGAWADLYTCRGTTYNKYLWFFTPKSISSGSTTEEVLNDFKAWLGTHNTTCYYVLATPTYTQITGEPETQLNNIYKNMLSYKGTTNVSQINNDLPFVLGVSAMKDINAMISELTNAIIELGGE